MFLPIRKLTLYQWCRPWGVANARKGRTVATTTVAKKTAKKVTKKAPAKKAAKKVAKKVTKKAPAKKAAKKVAKKVAAKKTAKKVAKKTAAKKVTKKVAKPAEHAVTKKAPAAKKAPAKAAPAPKKIERDATKPLTKTQLIAIISETVQVEKKKVSAIIEFLPDLINKELAKPGLFQLPGLLKIEKKKIPAQKAIKNWKNPFTGEITTKPAKPASNKIKVRPLKKLKDMA